MLAALMFSRERRETRAENGENPRELLIVVNFLFIFFE